MTRDEARAELEALNSSIATAVILIRSQQEIIKRFLKESRDMDNFGHIVDPTLFNSSERRVTAALLKPVYEAADQLVRVYDTQCERAAAALAKARGGADA